MPTIPELFEQAVRFHQAGKLAQAEPLYRQVIDADPSNAHAVHMLGLLAQQTGQPKAAIALIRRAISLNPTALAFHFNLGLVHKDQGQLVEAAQCFRTELAINPNHGDSLNNLGIVLVSQGKLVDAIACYLQALPINPSHADAHNNLGIARMLQRQHAEGIKCFREALRLDPHNVNAHINLGNALKDLGNLAEASACFQEALRINPNLATAHNNLGLVLMSQGQQAEAADCFRQALKINPTYANAHNNLGNALQDLNEPAEAVESYRKALELNPDNANILTNLGSALVAQGELADATETFLLALRINPSHVDANNNLGLSLVGQGKLDEAIDCFEKALSLDGNHRMAVWNRACLRLLQGDFAGGWAGYEHRWAQPDMAPRMFSQPRWDGEPLEGKTLLVYAEQGLGDTIQFLRYLPRIKERGGEVLFESQAALYRSPREPEPGGGTGSHLLKSCQGLDQVVQAGAALPAFDVQIPLLSLPGVFGTTLATIPAKVPYLTADPRLVEHWRKELTPPVSAEPKATADVTRKQRSSPAGSAGLEKPATARKIGIVWQGSMNQKGDRRSAPLAGFDRLARVAGIRLVSLQVGPGIEQLALVDFPVTDLGSRFDPNSLDDVAAALMNVDLLVTVDTAVAHLAGALGVPVWVALALSADWRWLLDRADNPWYPTMRLFRQPSLGDWNGVFERIAAELEGTQVAK